MSGFNTEQMREYTERIVSQIDEAFDKSILELTETLGGVPLGAILNSLGLFMTLRIYKLSIQSNLSLAESFALVDAYTASAKRSLQDAFDFDERSH